MGLLNDATARIKYLEEQNRDLLQELQRKDNNWNELKEWLDKRSEFTNIGTVLDKIKELESK